MRSWFPLFSRCRLLPRMYRTWCYLATKCSQEISKRRTTKFQSRRTQPGFKSLVLLFGFCQAPFVFTKVCRVIVRFCGALLIHVLNFVDDFLFSADPSKIA